MVQNRVPTDFRLGYVTTKSLKTLYKEAHNFYLPGVSFHGGNIFSQKFNGVKKVNWYRWSNLPLDLVVSIYIGFPHTHPLWHIMT